MPVKILMPALSPTMTEGNLVRWLKKEGDQVRAGQVLAEIETDKATMEVEAVDEGTIAKILVPEGTESVAVNTLIAVLLEEDEDPSSMDGFLAAQSGETKKEAISSAAPAGSTATVETSTPTSPVPASSSQEQRIFASPLARRIASDNQVDLASLDGSGPKGRIVKADVEKAIAAGSVGTSTTTAKSSESLVYGDAGYAEIPLNNMRKVIAKRLTESKQQVPHFYLSVDCNLDALLALRAEINSRLENGKLSVNDFVVRATALALIKVPAANASWHDTHIRQYEAADVCVAVAIENGLVTPVVRSANLKSLTAISSEVKVLAERARAGKLKPEEFQGGSFTISNLGMYGVNNFAAIINPPQACIMAVGAGEQKAVVIDGEIKIATMMNCTISVDHRAVDGATGANFLARFKEYIEDPLLLLL